MTDRSCGKSNMADGAKHPRLLGESARRYADPSAFDPFGASVRPVRVGIPTDRRALVADDRSTKE